MCSLIAAVEEQRKKERFTLGLSSRPRALCLCPDRTLKAEISPGEAQALAGGVGCNGEALQLTTSPAAMAPSPPLLGGRELRWKRG